MTTKARDILPKQNLFGKTFLYGVNTANLIIRYTKKDLQKAIIGLILALLSGLSLILSMVFLAAFPVNVLLFICYVIFLFSCYPVAGGFRPVHEITKEIIDLIMFPIRMVTSLLWLEIVLGGLLWAIAFGGYFLMPYVSILLLTIKHLKVLLAAKKYVSQNKK